MKENIKRLSQMNEKSSRNKPQQQKSYQRDKQMGCIPSKILGTILETYLEIIQINGLQDKKTDDDVHSRDDIVTAPNSYRPITCLPIKWEILMAQIREEIYFLLTGCELFTEDQKGYCKGSRSTEELLCIPKTRRKKSGYGLKFTTKRHMIWSHKAW